MINKEKYKRELVRIWDTLRDDKYKGIESCSGVNDCDECPLYNIKCGESFNAFEFIEAIEKWSKERPQKHKISKLEYDILKIYSDDYFYYFYESELLKLLFKKGYFKGANEKMNVTYYLRNCEVEDDTDKR